MRAFSMDVAAGAGAGGGGATLSEIHGSALRLLLSIRDGISRLERMESSARTSSSYESVVPSGVAFDTSELAYSLKRDLTQIQSLCADMDRLWRSASTKPQRDLWKKKIEKIMEEVSSLEQSLEKHSNRQRTRMVEAKERAELLQRRSGNSEHVLKIFDDEAQAMQSAHNSSMLLDEAYATGVAVLSKYAEQREHLKRAQRKALDILNTVGLSNAVLKLIERRHHVDKWIAYAGMITTLIVVLVFWRWTH